MANPFDDLIPAPPARPTARPNPFDDIVVPGAVQTAARFALEEATRLPRLTASQIPELLRVGGTFLTRGYPAAEAEVRNRLFPILQAEAERQQSLAALAAERPFAAGAGSLLGSLPAFAVANRLVAPFANTLTAQRLASTIPGQVALRAGLGAETLGLTEALQVRPEAIPRSMLMGAATFPAQAIPRRIPRILATGGAGGLSAAALAPPGQRIPAAVFGGGAGALAGALPAYDPLRRTTLDTPRVIAARAQANVARTTARPLTAEQIAVRAAMRESVATEMYGTGASQKVKQAYLVIGPPAAGKSKLIAEPLAQQTGSLLLDSDIAKARLAERLRVPMRQAGILHDESSDITDRILLTKARVAGDNIVLPLIGKTTQKIRNLRNELLRDGYDVHLVLSELPIKEAAKRAVDRYLRVLRIAPQQSRFVDPEYVLGVGDRPLATYEVLRQEGGLKSYARVSANVPRGSPPKVLEVSPGSPLAGLPIYGGEVGRANLVKVAVSKTLAEGGVGPPVAGIPAGSAPEGPLAPRLTVRSTEEIASAAQRLIQRDPADPIATEQAPRLFQRIAVALRQGRISADDIPALRDAGLTTEEAAGLFEEAASFSGQTLNRLSQVWRQIERLAPDLATTLDQAPSPPLTAWQRLQNLPRRVVNIWRASLVSQLATAVRNFAVFHQRLVFKAIEDGVNGAFESATGRKPVGQAFGPMLENVLAYGRAIRRGNRARILSLIASGDPLLKEKLMRTPVHDATITGRYAKFIGTFNNTQEYFSRTIAADAVIAGELRRGGLTGQPPSIPVLKKAVDRALDMTFAKYPSSKTGQAFLKAWNNPLLNILTYPFPRYLTNAVRAIWEHSPGGAMRLLHPRYQAILRSGDPRAAVEIATRAGLGSAMFAAASWIRNSQFAGEKWYEIRVGNRTVDARPYGPLLPVYLFLAQAVKDPDKLQLRDWIEGTLGINRMAGTTLFLTSVLAGENPQTLKRKLAEFAGTFAGGFTVPLRTFQDFVAQFSQEDAIIRETREAPLTGPTRANIPFISRGLPEKRVVTRGGPIRREQPGLRQLTGLTVRTKTPLERELDRLGLASFQLEPRLGEQSIERSIVTRMGPVAEHQIGAIVRSARYQQLDDERRTELLRRAFSDLRRGAKAHLIETEPGTIAKPFQRRFRQGTPQQRRQLQESLKRKGLFRGRVPQALVR